MYLTRLYPSPNKYTENTGEAFTFGSECTIVLPDCLTDGEVKNIADLFSRFTFTASRANIVRGSGLTALVGGYPAAEAPDAGEYYTVHSDKRGAVVSAVSKKGAYRRHFDAYAADNSPLARYRLGGIRDHSGRPCRPAVDQGADDTPLRVPREQDVDIE